MNASVCFVSSGPGAADLITLRGLQRLSQAAVVLADALADPALRAFAPQANWIDVGKRGFAHGVRQSEINALLLQQAHEATGLVVRLKGGDASVFGRLEEELEVLHEAGIATEVVPGVTAALAAAAHAQRPLTRRGLGRRVTLATAMTREGASGVTPNGATADTEVFYMAGRQLPGLQQRLLAAGWAPDTPALVVSRAGCADALTSEHRLDRLADATLLHGGRPTVVTVGVGARAICTAPLTKVKSDTQANPEPHLELAVLSGPTPKSS
ncbi:MAG: uroporphyrinogen-III C-methyltransferase [Burkholderiales bacterium]|uniref:uroporphyrinogen-III C-methyltransferase n=1 Tax=Inhella sp. TaxID=1921806 RepID=UPI001AD1357C|nr:uroporphyrinogen-III C-methyltransferase [Burkholderiales bacterium]